MTKLQEDLLGLYNTLTDFSEATLLDPKPRPINVNFSEGLNSLCFEQKNLKVALSVLNYYCSGLKKIKDAYLLPEDYDTLMADLSKVINKGYLLHERVCVAPMKYGFKLYETPQGIAGLQDGPQLLGSFEFVTSNSWVFKKIIKMRYEGF